MKTENLMLIHRRARSFAQDRRDRGEAESAAWPHFWVAAAGTTTCLRC